MIIVCKVIERISMSSTDPFLGLGARSRKEQDKRRTSIRKELEPQLERAIAIEAAIFKARCTFLPDCQVRGKVLEKLGIPRKFGGEIDWRQIGPGFKVSFVKEPGGDAPARPPPPATNKFFKTRLPLPPNLPPASTSRGSLLFPSRRIGDALRDRLYAEHGRPVVEETAPLAAARSRANSASRSGRKSRSSSKKRISPQRPKDKEVPAKTPDPKEKPTEGPTRLKRRLFWQTPNKGAAAEAFTTATPTPTQTPTPTPDPRAQGGAVPSPEPEAMAPDVFEPIVSPEDINKASSRPVTIGILDAKAAARPASKLSRRAMADRAKEMTRDLIRRRSVSAASAACSSPGDGESSASSARTKARASSASTRGARSGARSGARLPPPLDIRVTSPPTEPQPTQPATPQLEATQLRTPQMEATQRRTPQMEATQRRTPQMEATQRRTPQMEATQRRTPQMEATQRRTPQMEATQRVTPHMEATQRRTPQMEATQRRTPQMEATQRRSSQMEATQRVTPQMEDTQRRSSQIEATQSFNPQPVPRHEPPKTPRAAKSSGRIQLSVLASSEADDVDDDDVVNFTVDYAAFVGTPATPARRRQRRAASPPRSAAATPSTASTILRPSPAGVPSTEAAPAAATSAECSPTEAAALPPPSKTMTVEETGSSSGSVIQPSQWRPSQASLLSKSLSAGRPSASPSPMSSSSSTPIAATPPPTTGKRAVVAARTGDQQAQEAPLLSKSLSAGRPSASPNPMSSSSSTPIAATPLPTKSKRTALAARTGDLQQAQEAPLADKRKQGAALPPGSPTGSPIVPSQGGRTSSRSSKEKTNSSLSQPPNRELVKKKILSTPARGAGAGKPSKQDLQDDERRGRPEHHRSGSASVASRSSRSSQRTNATSDFVFSDSDEDDDEDDDDDDDATSPVPGVVRQLGQGAESQNIDEPSGSDGEEDHQAHQDEQYVSLRAAAERVAAQRAARGARLVSPPPRRSRSVTPGPSRTRSRSRSRSRRSSRRSSCLSSDSDTDETIRRRDEARRLRREKETRRRDQPSRASSGDRTKKLSRTSSAASAKMSVCSMEVVMCRDRQPSIVIPSPPRKMTSSEDGDARGARGASKGCFKGSVCITPSKEFEVAPRGSQQRIPTPPVPASTTSGGSESERRGVRGSRGKSPASQHAASASAAATPTLTQASRSEPSLGVDFSGELPSELSSISLSDEDEGGVVGEDDGSLEVADLGTPATPRTPRRRSLSGRHPGGDSAERRRPDDTPHRQMPTPKRRKLSLPPPTPKATATAKQTPRKKASVSIQSWMPRAADRQQQEAENVADAARSPLTQSVPKKASKQTTDSAPASQHVRSPLSEVDIARLDGFRVPTQPRPHRPDERRAEQAEQAGRDDGDDANLSFTPSSCHSRATSASAAPTTSTDISDAITLARRFENQKFFETTSVTSTNSSTSRVGSICKIPWLIPSVDGNQTDKEDFEKAWSSSSS